MLGVDEAEGQRYGDLGEAATPPHVLNTFPPLVDLEVPTPL